jgi:aminocarboxymuconate-semialdehyde decarboxylase
MAAKGNLAIDVHAHAEFEVVEKLVHGQAGLQQAIEERNASSSKESSEHNRKLYETVYQPMFRTERRLAVMDKAGVDMQAVSASPNHYHYWAERDLSQKLVSTINEQIAELCAKHLDRFAGLGTVSLQHPDLVAGQLEHGMRNLSLKGVIISTVANGVSVADRRYEPFWAKAEDLGALVFIHPAGCAIGDRLVPYYLSNVIGNPLETTIALAHIVFSGILDRHPRLKICGAHGGGYFPFYTSRFDHGWHVRPEARTCQHAPSEYLKRLWFDALVYTPGAVEYLVRQAGASQVVLGTDYPYDMGFEDPVARLNAVSGLSEADRQAIRGGNAARLLNL